MDDKEIEAVLSLPAQLSYAYLVKRIVGRQRIWSLGTEEGWALSSDDEGRELVPVWPHERFAAACAEGSWRGYSPNPQLPYLLTRALTEGRIGAGDAGDIVQRVPPPLSSKPQRACSRRLAMVMTHAPYFRCRRNRNVVPI
jgi:hypothetical protein